MKDIQTTQQEAMCQVHELKDDYQPRDTHKPMVAYDNFENATADRETGKPERGYGSVLPRYQLQFGKRHLDTTHRVDYQYPFDWTPKPEEVPRWLLQPHPQAHSQLFKDTDSSEWLEMVLVTRLFSTAWVFC